MTQTIVSLFHGLYFSPAQRGAFCCAVEKERKIMAVEFLWNAAFWKTTAEFAPIVTATGVALALAIIALCTIRAQREAAIRMRTDSGYPVKLIRYRHGMGD